MESFFAQLSLGRSFLHLRQRRNYFVGRIQQFITSLFPQCSYMRDQLEKTRVPEAAFPGDIRIGEERLPVRSHYDGQWPATAAGEPLADQHVSAVYIRSFLPIHLDVDEGFIHQGSYFLVFERFSFHYVTPVAGGISYRKENGPVCLDGGIEGFFAPRVPVHRVVGVLQQVRAFLTRQT